jgi:ADP-heptose:LPS heptosyltransferase
MSFNMALKSLSWYLRALYFRVERGLYPRFKRRNVTLYRYTAALGDALMLTSVAREVRKRNPNAFIHVITGLPSVFSGNPDIDRVTPEPEVPVPGLGRYLIRYEHKFPWNRHLLHYCMEGVDIYDAIELKTYIYPTSNDLEWAEKIISGKNRPIVIINRKAGPRTDKKNWPEVYWDKLIEKLVQSYYIIEVGVDSHMRTEGSAENYLNLVNKTTIHQTAALLSKSGLLICPVTGLLHLASAFNLPKLCILGGSEPSCATNYPRTHFLENRPVCADCYERGPCMNDFICLSQISPDQVLLKVGEVLDN